MRIQIQLSNSINAKYASVVNDDTGECQSVDVIPLFYANRKETPILEFQVNTDNDADCNVFVLTVKQDGELALKSLGKPIKPLEVPQAPNNNQENVKKKKKSCWKS